ncbi:MAG TPA: HD domain-containing protein [Nitrosopumilaceae archaeon]|nr:HD domain-containing protein [Nitrosopumilaceae archaeon]
MENSFQIIIKAKSFAHEKHRNQKRKDKVTPFIDHLEKVVNRLKNLGISDNNVLSAAWLHDTIEYTDTTFDEINQIFGNTISVIVLSLTKDLQLAKKERETQYIQQLRNSTLQAKLIKFCDISANLKDISNSPISKTQKNKQVKKLFHYLRIIKKDISKNKSNYPKISEHIDGINAVGAKFRQRPIIF